MRETKFRGLSKETKELVYGSYYHFLPCYAFILRETLQDGKIHAIIKTGAGDMPVEFIPVIPETVGQFTGLHDKNGKEIYGGDIVKSDKLVMKIVWLEKEETTVNDEYINHCWATCNVIDNTFEQIGVWAWSKFENIGNIHEKPELLES